MSAEEMKLSMQRTWVNNKWWTHIPTHYIVGCSGDIMQINTIDKIVWATLSQDANANGIHIEVVGDFNTAQVPQQSQYDAVTQIIKRIGEKKPWLEIKKHSDFQQKMCPWVNFDMTKISNFVPIPHANGAKRMLPKIKGDTVEARAKSFIGHYWYEYKEFVIKWLKPEVLICIARAEWFGKNSWSTGNIMNCWNNDRWDRVDFDHYGNSVDCAAHKLYAWLLKNKQTIGDLSYAWNGKIDMQYIYASSNWPREINVRNCLWLIYNKQISPDFTFRK